MPGLEYEELTVAPEADLAAALNAKGAEGWRVHTAYSATHYLLERGGPSTGLQPLKTPASPHR